MQQAQPQAQPGAGAPALPQQPLTPEQTRQMQIMAKQAMGLLLEDATAEMIVQQSQQGEPAQVIAQMVVGVMGQLYEAASGAGQQVEMVTLLVTGIQIIGTLAEMLVAAGVIEEATLPQFVAQASKIAVDMHNATVSGGQGAMQ